MHSLLAIFIAIFCLTGMPTLAHAAKAKSSKAVRHTKVRSHSSGHGLAQDWEPTYDLKTYQQNYLLLFALSSQPNNLPTSPNPLNQVLVPYSLDNRDIKFQISLKFALADNQEFGSLWFAYTQLSLWQFYNKANSQPFRETVYSPELIYSLRPFDGSILNFGLIHQSNGESNPRSRSWNRYYVQTGVDIFDSGSDRLLLQARWWQRFMEIPANDDNPDIGDFLGYREVELRYAQQGGWQISTIARSKSVQVDIAAPWTSWLMLDDSYEHSVNLHLQYFSGYGESLLDYNQNHVTWGVGLSLPLN
jgi:phospholipase A1